MLLFSIGALGLSQLLWIMSVERLGIGLSAMHINAAPFYVMLILFALGGIVELVAGRRRRCCRPWRADRPGPDPPALRSHAMKTLSQSPTDPAFVQNPYPFYETARAPGPFFLWTDYAMPCTGNAAAVNAIFRDRRLGRESPVPLNIPAHLRPFYAVEAHSMLELEPPRHTRLRTLVLRAFTSRRIDALHPEIATLTHQLIDAFPAGEFDLLKHFGQTLPVIIIARLLGVPEAMSRDLLRWSNAMVGMYMAGRNRACEDRAVAATEAFVAFMRGYVEARRSPPRATT